jgi:hypothetical protein
VWGNPDGGGEDVAPKQIVSMALPAELPGERVVDNSVAWINPPKFRVGDNQGLPDPALLDDLAKQIAGLEAEIEELLVQLEAFNSGGANGSTDWQVLVVDSDNHWQEIITTNINLLGGTAIDYRGVPTEKYPEIIEACQAAVVGALVSPENGLSANEWVEQMIQLSHRLPIILLSSWNERSAAISLRQALLKNDKSVTITTIFKENFDSYWFSQVIHQILAH